MNCGYLPYRVKHTARARENRKKPTQAEQIMWYEVLRKKQFKNCKFLRQKPIGNFIVDFYCAQLLLVIEIDGPIHEDQKEYDAYRTSVLNEYSILVLRYTNDEVMFDLEAVRADLGKHIETRLSFLNLPPKSPLHSPPC
ncbi:MAG: hypothetical protein A2V81_00150 [Candidatus Abawacabacteria bacterium RBG_16_42_10]|uniref:DUF559 domain-containing protein n=1 Tax=Candidatus Abawacabacteria bacterium RBG_16_42_10 TaxID=1817814 RepID=A0A1F4XN00_9BACT|nr:MAG: hypothetical protein A2V81_00150 [Candidatus Abawacabacteria bacterium RBG_16_42_10]